MGLPDHARLGLAYGMSLLAWWTDSAPRPFAASFAVTNRCNLRCSYCNTPFLDPRELPLADVRTLFDRLRGLGVRRLGLVGGEPLVRRDIDAVVDCAKQAGFHVSLNSNLLLYQRRREVFDPVDLVFTSLDGGPEVHRRNRGEASFDGVTGAVRDLVGRGKPVIAIAVVTSDALEPVDFLLDEAESAGFKVHFQPQCTDTEIVRGGLDDRLTDEGLRSLWTGILRRKREGRPIASSTHYLEAQSRWSDFRVSAWLDPEARCAAGRGFLYVDPQGNAYPCAYTKGKAQPVSLLEEDWRSAFPGRTPCTRCNVGPMLEFNLLFQRPLSSSLAALDRLE